MTNEYKIITHKTKKGYESHVFEQGNVKSIYRAFAKLRKHSISFAESYIEDVS